MKRKLKIGSLFSGSGCWELAAQMCGIKPAWAAEIEPFPIAVTKQRFPNMKHLGSVTNINGTEVEPVDVITSGSPCQDLSLAGRRPGLKHDALGDEERTRSGLFMEGIRIIKEMRNATGGKYPAFATWENVPGAFSSNRGEDFRIVIEAFARIADGNAHVPRPAEWRDAGAVMGDGWSVAWRVLDSKFWGVAQRRRRIFLVADFGNGGGQQAPKILFEREGLRGDFAQSIGAWQGTPRYIESRTCPAGRDDGSIGFPAQNYSEYTQAAPSARKGASAVGSTKPASETVAGNKSAIVLEHHPMDSRVKILEDGIFQTLPSNMGTGGCNVPMVMEDNADGAGR